MRRLVPWLAASSVLALGGCPALTEPCGAHCGPGTRCEGERCVPAQAGEETGGTGPSEPSEGNSKKKKKRRKGSRRSGGEGDDGEAASAPPRVDDSRVPKYDDKRLQEIGMADGTERLSDFEVRKHMRRLEPKFDKCIADATLRTDAEIKGSIVFEIGIEPSGKVWGVNAKANKVLRDAGVVSCVRVVVHKHRFPSWHGPAMGVDYSFDIG